MAKNLAVRDRLLRLVDACRKKRLGVIGDLIADEFLHGQTARISREAPVLVLQYRDTVRLPGGGANAANNLLALGCGVRVAGVVGSDAAGRDLVRMLHERGADTRLVEEAPSYTTPVKTRILAGAHHSSMQQIVRIDRVGEGLTDRPPAYRSAAKAFGDCHGLILSDYGYGSAPPSHAREIARFARLRAVPLVVDSRFRMSEFRGVTAVTPNITELEAAAGVSIGGDATLLERTGARVVRRQKLDFLLVTQGRYGMTLISPPRSPFHIPIYGSDEVADVTGAGDTVIAVFTAALACGAAPEDAARLANYAGGIVVMKRGTATASPAELQEAVRLDLSS